MAQSACCQIYLKNLCNSRHKPADLKTDLVLKTKCSYCGLMMILTPTRKGNGRTIKYIRKEHENLFDHIKNLE